MMGDTSMHEKTSGEAFKAFAETLLAHVQQHPHLSRISLGRLMVILTTQVLEPYPAPDIDHTLTQIIRDLEDLRAYVKASAP